MLSYHQVDVFTDEFLLGNPVAVVHNADLLSTAQMAAFARWTNLSETTFLLTPKDPAADYRLRIFTTGRELPFAGHPTLGSARAWLEAGGVGRQDGTLVQECGAGLVPIRRDGDRLAFAAPPLLRGGAVGSADLQKIARGLRVAGAEIVDAQWADNGPGWVAVLLTDAETVLRIHPDHAAMAGLNIGIVGPYPAGSPEQLEVRAFVPDVAGGEDPVTGSLNAGIAQWLIGARLAPPVYTVSQGTCLQRRGRVHIQQVREQIWVGGDTVVGIAGTVAL